jgi:hypothetical protein
MEEGTNNEARKREAILSEWQIVPQGSLRAKFLFCVVQIVKLPYAIPSQIRGLASRSWQKLVLVDCTTQPVLA